MTTITRIVTIAVVIMAVEIRVVLTIMIMDMKNYGSCSGNSHQNHHSSVVVEDNNDDDDVAVNNTEACDLRAARHICW